MPWSCVQGDIACAVVVSVHGVAGCACGVLTVRSVCAVAVLISYIRSVSLFVSVSVLYMCVTCVVDFEYMVGTFWVHVLRVLKKNRPWQTCAGELRLGQKT